MKTDHTHPSLRWRAVFATLIGLFALLLIGGMQLHQSEGRQQHQRVREQLLAVSELKARQISEWRNERTADGQVATDNSLLIAAADAFLQGKSDGAALRQLMLSLKENYHYREVLLLDAAGNLRLSLETRRTTFTDDLVNDIERAHQSRRAIQTDLHLDAEKITPHAEIIAPLQIGQGTSLRRVGTLLLQIDPKISLLPKLGIWPLPTKTAETLLVRRDGDQVLFVSEVHQRTGIALRLPPEAGLNASAPDQVIEAIDYEGMPVLASLQPIPDTGWYILAKIGRDEALAGWHHASYLIIALTAGLLLAVVIAGAFIYQRRGLARYRTLFETEAAHRAEQQRFQVAFHASPLCASITRLSDGTIIDANDNFLRNFGRSRAEMIGRTSLDIALWPDQETRQKLLALLAREERVVNHATIWIDQHGAVHHVEISASLIDIAGETFILAFTADVTERQQAQAELEQYRRRLEAMVDERTYELAIAKENAERASRTKSAFLANMSHEIRTPLNAVIGLTHLMLLDTREPRQTERLGRITDAAHHLLGVINDILDISKIEADKLELDETDFSTRKILDETVKMIEFKAHDKGLALITDIAPDLPPGLHGDPLRLQQILLNFLSNAVKFTERGHIRLNAQVIERQDNEVQLRFEVEDTGIGIPTLARPRLFQPFEQADGSTTRHFGGTGLGLAISRKLALKMGGDTGVNSMPGEGSTFWVTVRLKLATQAVCSETSSPSQDGEAEIRETRNTARILLVEDDPLGQEVALDLLAHTGLLADLAANGEQAVAMAGEHHYDLILMDLQMPVMNGLDAARAILALPGRSMTTIVAMTASAFSEDRQACLAAGMVDHLAKPVEPAALHELLLRWLPMNKISPQSAAAPDETDQADALVGRLAAIPGFDTRVGLASLSGKADKYVKLLDHYLKHHLDIAPRISQLLSEADYTTAQREAHTLKGACAALGLSDTREAAAQLEQALRRAAPDEELQTLLASLDAANTRQRHQLAAILSQASSPEAATAHNPDSLQALLQQLETLLAEDNIRSIEIARQGEAQLRGLLGDDYPQLVEQLEIFDFPAALKLLKQHLAAQSAGHAEAAPWH